MRKSIILLGIVLLSLLDNGYGQMNLATNLPNTYFELTEIVNLSRSGKKIMTVRDQSSINLADTLFFYNLDYSFWKSIPCPAKPGYSGYFTFYHFVGQSPGIFYPSETLFNLDTLLEVAILYIQNTTGLGTIYIINERGNLTDSINNIYYSSSERFKVFEGNSGEFKAIVSTTAGMSVYNLPGTIPCNSCYDPLGLAKNDDNNKANKIESLPIPNPSKDEVKITFTLPDGVTKAKLSLYTTNGQLVKTYDVDNRFGFIMLDNSALPSGLYFYNIEVNGFVSSSQKIVVVK